MVLEAAEEPVESPALVESPYLELHKLVGEAEVASVAFWGRVELVEQAVPDHSPSSCSVSRVCGVKEASQQGMCYLCPELLSRVLCFCCPRWVFAR